MRYGLYTNAKNAGNLRPPSSLYRGHHSIATLDPPPVSTNDQSGALSVAPLKSERMNYKGPHNEGLDGKQHSDHQRPEKHHRLRPATAAWRAPAASVLLNDVYRVNQIDTMIQ